MGLALSELTKGLQWCKSWPELPVTTVRIAHRISQDLHGPWLGDSPLASVSDTSWTPALGLKAKDRALQLSPALWPLTFSPRALVLLLTAADLGAVDPSVTHPQGPVFPHTLRTISPSLAPNSKETMRKHAKIQRT